MEATTNNKSKLAEAIIKRIERKELIIKHIVNGEFDKVKELLS